MPAELLTQVARDMDTHADAVITTLSAPLTDKERLFDPNVVKVVIDAEGYALYFSRAPIPWHRMSLFIKSGRYRRRPVFPATSVSMPTVPDF